MEPFGTASGSRVRRLNSAAPRASELKSQEEAGERNMGVGMTSADGINPGVLLQGSIGVPLRGSIKGSIGF